MRRLSNLLAAGLACMVFSAAAGARDAPQPDIILFIADDLTYWDLGAYGGQARTPHIDRLAEQGMKFERAYQNVAVCSPTRQNLLTGLYPVRNGAYPQGSYIHEHVRTLPHYLEPLGYTVAHVGKRHFNPLEQYPFEFLSEDKSLDFEAIDNWLAARDDQPFFLMVATPEPHFRWEKTIGESYDPESLELPANWVDTPETRDAYSRYLAEISYQDDEVGQLVSLLKKHGRWDGSVLIYTSEQGASFPYAKWTAYEAGVHTGLIVRWPGNVAAGSSTPAIVEYTDVLPTVIEIAGGKAPRGLDGGSFVEVLRGDSDQHRRYTYSMQTTRGEPWGGDHFAVRGIRDNRYTYIINLHPYMLFENHLTRYGDGFFNSWRNKAWKDDKANKLFLGYITRSPEELYDRQADPMELNNLVDDPDYANTRARLAKALEAWMEHSGDLGHETEMAAWDRQLKRPEAKTATE